MRGIMVLFRSIKIKRLANEYAKEVLESTDDLEGLKKTEAREKLVDAYAREMATILKSSSHLPYVLEINKAMKGQ